MVSNYYNILGVSNTASQAEIKQSFRNLALKYHPDKNKNSDQSKQKFMQVVEAYEILSDEQTRKNYDNVTYLGSYNYTPKRPWTPSADFNRIYSYVEIKRRYRQNTTRDRSGGLWDISENASVGMWKATIMLFGCLGAAVMFIMLIH
ncbi:MAG TPA: J domain-containing protein [Nitrososphaeraceae archaeon]|nr:J domain-containing protein [Nitrososphaeraceae archaeon]